MANIVNRDLDASERQSSIQGNVKTSVTGATYKIGVVSFPSQVIGAWEAATGASGAPGSRVGVHRFIVGTGGTIITGLFASAAVTTFGVSGLFGHSLIGATSFRLLPGDVLFYETFGANAALAETQVTVVVQALQDTKQWLGAIAAPVIASV